MKRLKHDNENFILRSFIIGSHMSNYVKSWIVGVTWPIHEDDKVAVDINERNV